MLPLSGAQQENREICRDDYKGLACAPGLSLEFHADVRVQHRLTAATNYTARRPCEYSLHLSARAIDSARLQFKRILPVRVPGRSDL